MVAALRTGIYRLANGLTIDIPYDEVFNWGNKSPLPTNLNPFDVGTAQLYPLGFKVMLNDRTYRYVEFGGTTKAGDVCQREGPDAAHDDLAVAAAAIGATVLTISTAITLVVNEYVGGSLNAEADTGLGYNYMVLKHDVDAAAGGATVTITPPLAIAVDTSSDIKLVKSAYKEVIIAPTTLTGAVVGISCCVGADGSFGFVQTTGDATVLTDGTLVIGQVARVSETTAGSAAAQDYDEAADADFGAIGRVVDVGPTTEQSIVRLDGFE